MILHPIVSIWPSEQAHNAPVTAASIAVDENCDRITALRSKLEDLRTKVILQGFIKFAAKSRLHGRDLVCTPSHQAC